MHFGLRSQQEAEQYPVLYALVSDRVKPERDANKREVTAPTYWWRFGEPRREWRTASEGLPRYNATVETSKHRFFVFLGSDVAPDNKLICIASADPFHLGVLSSWPRVTWALAAGGKLGVGTDPVYVKTRSFDAFPFPDPRAEVREFIAAVAERLGRHRWDVLARRGDGDGDVWWRSIRCGDLLTSAERKLYEIAAYGVPLDLHDEMDRLVVVAYGWLWPTEMEEILARLIEVRAERAQEEEPGDAPGSTRSI